MPPALPVLFCFLSIIQKYVFFLCFFTVLLLYFKQIFFSILTNPSYRLYTLSIMKITLDTDIGFKNPNSDVDFNIWDRPSSDLHDHTFYEVFIVTQGELRHIVNGKKEEAEDRKEAENRKKEKRNHVTESAGKDDAEG